MSIFLCVYWLIVCHFWWNANLNILLLKNVLPSYYWTVKNNMPYIQDLYWYLISKYFLCKSTTHLFIFLISFWRSNLIFNSFFLLYYTFGVLTSNSLPHWSFKDYLMLKITPFFSKFIFSYVDIQLSLPYSLKRLPSIIELSWLLF
jgi:hypothetical protein